MLYLLNLQLERTDESKKRNYYYGILWAMLNLFESDDELYNSILKIWFNVDNYLNIHLSINWKENYNKIVDKILSSQWKEISINNDKWTLKYLRFNFQLFEPKDIEYKDFNTFTLFFHSPTFIKNDNVNHYLPEPHRIMLSVNRKLSKIYPTHLEEDTFKQYLKKIYIWELEIKSKQVKLKNWIRAGIVWKVKYHLWDKEVHAMKKSLYMLLKSIPFVWVWSSVKLGCGNVTVFIK